MPVSYIKNHYKYLQRLHKTISENGLIEDPKALTKLVKIFQHNGEITGWEIRGGQITLASFDYLDCDEYASKSVNGQYILKGFSYHFNPRTKGYMSFRIDLEAGDLHFNPDLSIESKLGHRIPPDRLPLNIEDFNTLLALHIAMKYVTSGIYPTDDREDMYNKMIDGIRRLIS